MTSRERERYSRQILFHGLGEEGQEKLLASRAAIVGCGALGSFQADLLARAGVGSLTLVDRDYVEWSNLHRQGLFEESDAEQGLPKAVAAARRLARVNAGVAVAPRVSDLVPENVAELLGDAQIVLDGTDNFETRYLVNDFCVSRRIPWIYGGAVGSYGLVMAVLPDLTACFRCVYPEPPAGVQPTCETEGVLASVPAVIASLQAVEALKILAGRRQEVTPWITTVDVWKGVVRQVRSPERAPKCVTCAERRFQHLEGARRAPISLCGRNAVQIHERDRPLDLAALRERLAPLGEVRANEFALRFFLPSYEMTVFPDGRTIIKGTTDVGVARSLYARYVGN
jgi:adenylyltransferase/sulfurtransferase